MAWKRDGRYGTIRLGNEEVPGFALMRDARKGLIAFHVSSEPADQLRAVAPRLNSEFVVAEGEFTAAPLPRHKRR